MNETRFCDSCSRAYCIITLDLEKPIFLTDLDNQEYIICIENISIGGKTIPCILMLYDIQILEKWP